MRRQLFEEDPEPEDPDEPEAPEAPEGPAALQAAVPSIGGENREFEYRTEVLTTAKLTDGKTLAKALTQASKDGWDFVRVLSAADQHVVLLRKASKSAARSDRRVGFAIPRG